MALTDPQSIKISGTTTSLPRVTTGDHSSEYTSADGLITLKAATQKGKRNRQVIRFDVSKIVASTLNPSQNEEVSTSVQLVFDRPLQGFTNADELAIWAGVAEFLAASESKVIKAVLAGEN